ncbi:efflux transporter outer membrane subunit [Pusillimonas sp. SM2304]|uniref:efflux transporter outer membrane subunit n=1 Tax=Pusillimonas sp. SM2304 TaxID=3073241 RepID=UPI0028762CDB|nr:efflux transporter outer membrane subunit [Pusillimonas sp. SM2304]MDS1142224.1 efflux transporter outer membrane subunit [Pusillimonas sp. SM2304]
MRRWLAGCLMPLAAGCAVPLETAGPVMDLPAAWSLSAQAESAHAPQADWWPAFGSPELASFVVQAQADSFDLAGAAARVRQAQALARIAGADLLPALDAAMSVGRQKREGEQSGRAYLAGLSASYEVDLWGGNAAGRDAALATLSATQYAKEGLALTLAAEVASSYFQTAALRARTAIAQLNLASAERILDLVESRARAGAATPLELAQQRALTARQRQDLALRRQQAEDSLAALAVLLGRAPQDMVMAQQSLAGISAPPITAGLPSELITRRPDLARAERLLAAADADVAAARAAMLPRLTLAASATVSSGQWRRLFDTPLYSLAAGLAAPIFNAGRLSAGRDLALARREELLAGYRFAIISALSDVEKALNAIQGLGRQRQAQADVLANARQAVDLATSRYRWGAEPLLTVLDAQRTLYAAQDEAIQLDMEQLQASVGLFKALGGGWRKPEQGDAY